MAVVSQENDFDSILEKAIEDYFGSAEETKGNAGLTLDMLTDEMKEAMCLDLFPEDIQQDILALSQKIVEYAQAIAFAEAEKEEEEKGGPFPHSGSGYFTAGTRPLSGGMSYLPPSRYQTTVRQQPLGTWDKLVKCDRSVPTKQIFKDTFNNALTAGGALGLHPTSAPYALSGAFVAAVGTTAGAYTGHMVGCMQRAHFR